MQTESVQLDILPSSEHRYRKQISQFLCSAIMYLALGIIVFLTIPMCLFLGAIVGVWTVTDKLIRIIECHMK